MKDEAMFKCKHALGTSENEIKEKLCFCEIYGQNRNITLGECLGNCECEECNLKEENRGIIAEMKEQDNR